MNHRWQRYFELFPENDKQEKTLELLDYEFGVVYYSVRVDY